MDLNFYNCPKCRKPHLQIGLEERYADRYQSFCFSCDYQGPLFVTEEEAIAYIPKALVIEDILKERKIQDSIYGGPKNDDMNPGGDFIILIKKFAIKANDAGRHDDLTEMRRRLIQVAALTMAAVESYDRHEKEKQRKRG